MLNQPVDCDAAYKAWQLSYSVREYAGEVTAPILPAVKRG